MKQTNKMRKAAYWAAHKPLWDAKQKPEPIVPEPTPVLPDSCPLARKCGGCQMQNLPYERQLQWKQATEIRLLGRFGRVGRIIGMENPRHYRNKAQAAFGTTRSGKIVSGVYQSGTHRIVMVDRCMIQDPRADRIIVTIRGLLHDFKIAPYDEDAHTGLLRHVLVRTAHTTGQIMVVLVTSKPTFPSRNHFVEALRAAHPEITTIVQNINDQPTSMVLGIRETVLFGPGKIEDVLCGCKFLLSPRSFYQINAVQTEILYGKAIEFAGLTGTETVIDAYCGIGTIGLVAAPHAQSVIGVELNPDAVHDANTNARRNGIANAQFVQGDAGMFMHEMALRGESADVLLMDPPRAGSDRQFLVSAVQLAPSRIVYISCAPDTLARDLMFLTQHGYRVRKIQPVDMFPFTHHIETVVLLSKGEIDSKKVRVDFSLEGMDMSGFRNGTTHDQIKAYVLEHSGMKVSSLYISQVKRKCGLEVGDSYNKPKSESTQQPQCPPEKEKAIMEALKHFGMIR